MRRRLETSKAGLVRLLLLASAAFPSTASAQTDAPGVPDPDPFEWTGFGEGPYEEMEALLEVTIFNIDDGRPPASAHRRA
jgi:hypothetical protein